MFQSNVQFELYRKYNPDGIMMFLMSSKDINSPANVLFGDLYRNICSYLLLDESQIVGRSICDLSQCCVKDCSNFVCIDHGNGDVFTVHKCADTECKRNFCWEHNREPHLKSCDVCQIAKDSFCAFGVANGPVFVDYNYCHEHLTICEKLLVEDAKSLDKVR
jgi:hypothetical protein